MIQPVDSTEVNANRVAIYIIMIRIEIKYYVHNNFRKTHIMVILLYSYKVFISVFFKYNHRKDTNEHITKILPTFLLQDP